MAIGLVGIDMQTGQARLTLGLPQLLDGIPVVILAVGLFAVGEALFVVSRASRANETIIPVRGRVWMTAEEWRRSWKPWLRGAGIGFPFGTLPAGGAEIPTFLSYAVEKKLSKHPEEFGKGAIEGVAGPEATNNSAVTGVLVPLLTLGLPTSATAAIMLVAFQQYGLQPGPLLFSRNPDLVWGLIAVALYRQRDAAGAQPAARRASGCGCSRSRGRSSTAASWCSRRLGVYSLHGSVFDLGILYVVGALGYVMRCADIPIAPAIIGLILGPLAEQQFRRARRDQPGRSDGVPHAADLGDDPGGGGGGAAGAAGSCDSGIAASATVSYSSICALPVTRRSTSIDAMLSSDQHHRHRRRDLEGAVVDEAVDRDRQRLHAGHVEQDRHAQLAQRHREHDHPGRDDAGLEQRRRDVDDAAQPRRRRRRAPPPPSPTTIA